MFSRYRVLEDNFTIFFNGSLTIVVQIKKEKTMVKRISSGIMLCLILFSVFAVAASIQTAKACEEPRPVVIIVNDHVQLIFPSGTEGVSATATETERYPPLPQDTSEEVLSDTLSADGFIGPVWDIRVTGTFSGTVTVRIDYGETELTPTALLQTDIVLGDVNADGKVNLCDLLIILKALGSSPGKSRWNPYCDLNCDNKITLADFCIAFHNLGHVSVWTSITTYVDVENHVIYGETDHFSIFGVH
jgi:hypothetical protein